MLPVLWEDANLDTCSREYPRLPGREQKPLTWCCSHRNGFMQQIHNAECLPWFHTAATKIHFYL